jgi:hypothetical protein
LTSQRTIQWTFRILTSLVSIGLAVAEKTIKTTHFLTHLVLWILINNKK